MLYKIKEILFQSSETCKAFESRIELNKDNLLYWDTEPVFENFTFLKIILTDGNS